MCRVTRRPPAVVQHTTGVHPAPVLGVTLRLLPLWLSWLAVVALGRLVCHVAQRIPPVVHLVRLVRRRQARSAALAERR